MISLPTYVRTYVLSSLNFYFLYFRLICKNKKKTLYELKKLGHLFIYIYISNFFFRNRQNHIDLVHLQIKSLSLNTFLLYIYYYNVHKEIQEKK